MINCQACCLPLAACAGTGLMPKGGPSPATQTGPVRMRPGVYCLLAGQGLSLYPVLTDPRLQERNAESITTCRMPCNQGSGWHIHHRRPELIPGLLSAS